MNIIKQMIINLFQRAKEYLSRLTFSFLLALKVDIEISNKKKEGSN